MSVLSSLLVLVCVCVSMVVATSELNPDDHVMIANHLTAAAHSFHTFQSSTPTSSVFGPVAGASAACKSTSASLEANSTIIAAKVAVIASGCTQPATQQTGCSTGTCTCIATFSNDANLRSLVSQSGGQVCSIGIQFTASGNNGNLNFNYQGIGGLAVVGSSCISTDIQAMLTTAFDAIAEGIRETSKSSSTKIQSITGTMSFCGTTYTGTRQTNGAYNNNNKPVGIAIALLIGTIITFINAAL